MLLHPRTMKQGTPRRSCNKLKLLFTHILTAFITRILIFSIVSHRNTNIGKRHNKLNALLSLKYLQSHTSQPKPSTDHDNTTRPAFPGDPICVFPLGRLSLQRSAHPSRERGLGQAYGHENDISKTLQTSYRRVNCPTNLRSFSLLRSPQPLAAM